MKHFSDLPVTELHGIGEKVAHDLAEMEIFTLRDLICLLPNRYIDASETASILGAQVGEIVTIEAQVLSMHTTRTRNGISMTLVEVADETSTLSLTFFRAPYIERTLKAGESYAFTGKLSWYRQRPTLTNPKFERLESAVRLHTGRVVPIYPEHGAITSARLRRWLYELLSQYEENSWFAESLPASVVKKADILPKTKAWHLIHFPEKLADAEAARRRIAFDELWQLFARLEKERAEEQKKPAAARFDSAKLQSFFQNLPQHLPFPPTASQQKAFHNLEQKLSQPHATRTLVYGEVGSGKTIVAAGCLFAAAQQGATAAYVAPTTVLAEQHFKSLSPLAEKLGITLDLWTSNRKDRPKADVIIGTHAIFHEHAKETTWKPAVIVIDEEHRFGVSQREFATVGEKLPHLISMTATPIPRTLAYVLYGEDDCVFLDPIPGKDRQVTTRVVPATKLNAHFDWLQDQIQTQKSQAFLIAPFIAPSETEGFEHVFDATTVFELAKKHLPKAKIGLLTGKTKPAEKKRLLEAMHAHKLDCLVATPVIEVGIDIPGANVISILSAERFGLAQLHQLRGRVGRQGQASWCFLIPSEGQTGANLKAMEQHHLGSELAEVDLKNRGAGEFFGTRQSGESGMLAANWMDLELIKTVKQMRQNLTIEQV